MIHPLLSVNEIKASVEQTKSKAILILDQIYPKIARVQWDGVAPTVILTRVADALPFYAKPVYAVGHKGKRINTTDKTLYWNEFLKNGCSEADLPKPCSETDDVAAIMHSGGTTGTPKGVMLTNGNFNVTYGQMLDVCGFDYSMDMNLSTISFVPIFHGFGFGVCIHPMLCMGIRSYVIPVFDFEKCIKLIFKKKIQCIYSVPSFFEVFARYLEAEERDLSFIKMMVAGGDHLKPELKDKINGYMKKGGSGVEIQEAYGQTECVCSCVISPTFALKRDAIGIAYPDVKLKPVIPGTQTEAPAGEPGELCVCGPTVMKGYVNDPEATEKTLQRHSDGQVWLHTGDLVSMDSEGYITFKQRLSRMIINSGYNVYLNQIEEVIEKLSCIKECCAVGVADRITQKRVAVYAVMAEEQGDQEECERQIRSACADNLAAYSQPQRIIFVKSLPKTVLGKTDYAKMSASEVL